MDGKHFDDVVRAASVRGSRRNALRAIAGGLLAALVPATSAGKAKRGKKKPRRKSCTERCGGRCVARCPDVMTRNQSSCQCECPDRMISCGQICVGEDRCCPGEKKCGGGCIRAQDCCPYTERECPDGSCVEQGACCPVLEITCPADPRGCCVRAGEGCAADGCCPLVNGQRVCDDTCVDTKTDRDHCGACSWQCGANQECCDGSCKSLLSDEENCGACGHACDTRTQACFQGQCRDICSLNTDYTVACDEGGDYWCCPERSPRCCRMSGQPHCC